MYKVAIGLMTSEEGSAQRVLSPRCEARLSVDIRTAKLRQSWTSSVAVRVEDLSRHGFRAEWPSPLRVGQRVSLTLPGIEAKAATVKWAEGVKIGCMFEEPLHPAVLEHLLRRLASP